MTAYRLNVGKIRKVGLKYPWEAGYIDSVRAQMKDLTALLNGVMSQFLDASPEIMIEAMQPTFELSQAYCPVDTGAMKASGYLEVTNTGKEPRVELGYARGGVPFYTALQHETTDFYHEPPTRAKWLQAAVMEDLSNIGARLATGYNRFMGG
jgi:hypothetical protein